MVVTGTQQRVYGTLTGGCMIDLHRFALVSGSTTQSPTKASTVTYADVTPYRQCGYKYAGYLTLFLSISGSSVYAAVEVRICKNDAKRIVIETYGEVVKTVTGGMSLWFNKGTDASPDWVQLNSTTSGVVMPYATTSYTFKESKRNGSTTIDCCKKCPDCECMECSLPYIPTFTVITYRCQIETDEGHEYVTKYKQCSISFDDNVLQTYQTPDNYPELPVYDSYSSTISLTRLNQFVYVWNGEIEDIETSATAKLSCYKISWNTSIIDDVGSHTDTSETDFDYLKNCVTTSISFTGCKSVTLSFPINSSNNFTTATLTASLATSNAKSKCYEGSTAENYTNFTWDLDYGNTPVVETGKSVTHSWYLKGNKTTSYNVYVKTGDLYQTDPKYLELLHNSCIQISLPNVMGWVKDATEWNGWLVVGGYDKNESARQKTGRLLFVKFDSDGIVTDAYSVTVVATTQIGNWSVNFVSFITLGVRDGELYIGIGDQYKTCIFKSSDGVNFTYTGYNGVKYGQFMFGGSEDWISGIYLDGTTVIGDITFRQARLMYYGDTGLTTTDTYLIKNYGITGYKEIYGCVNGTFKYGINNTGTFIANQVWEEDAEQPLGSTNVNFIHTYHNRSLVSDGGTYYYLDSGGNVYTSSDMLSWSLYFTHSDGAPYHTIAIYNGKLWIITGSPSVTFPSFTSYDLI